MSKRSDSSVDIFKRVTVTDSHFGGPRSTYDAIHLACRLVSLNISVSLGHYMHSLFLLYLLLTVTLYLRTVSDILALISQNFKRSRYPDTHTAVL